MFFLWKFKDSNNNFNGDFVSVDNLKEYDELMSTGEYQDATGLDSQHLNEVVNGSHGYKSKPMKASTPTPKAKPKTRRKYKTKDQVAD